MTAGCCAEKVCAASMDQPIEEVAGELDDEQIEKFGDEEVDETYDWEAVKDNMRLHDIRRSVMMTLFSERYNITSSVDALINAPLFMDEFLVSEFNYREFVHTTGLCEDDMTEEEFEIYEEQNLKDDVALGVSLMNQMATTIAFKIGIPMGEVSKTMPGGGAIRTIPKCAVLARRLPGALCTCRAIKANLENDYTGKNPFEDEEAAAKLAEKMDCSWEDIQMVLGRDDEVKSCFAGRMRVSFVGKADLVSIVSLTAVPDGISSESPRPGVPLTQFTEEGPDVLVEVEQSIGDLLEEDMILDGDFYELVNGPWLMCSAPKVQSGLVGEKEDGEGEDEEEGDSKRLSVSQIDLSMVDPEL